VFGHEISSVLVDQALQTLSGDEDEDSSYAEGRLKQTCTTCLASEIPVRYSESTLLTQSVK
jgi:hypothetical protein